MALLFSLISIGLIIFILAYAFVIHRQQANQFKHQIAASESELKRLHESEKHLRDELNNVQSRLQHAIEDPITHLLGWQLFEDRLNQSIKESARYQFTMGVLFVDIDDFKMINEGLSHELGDLFLEEVAKRLQSCIRQVDSVSRSSKDTFVLILTQLAKPETAAVVAQRILQVLSQPFIINDQELYITACIGISIYPSDGQDAAMLLRNANEALKLAKGNGKHIYQFYQEKIHTDSQRELALHNRLRRDTVFQEFILFYQPIVNLQNESVFCMDALLHWQHPDLGLIGPHELCSYAERQRKLDAMTEWLLQNACRQFLEWRSLGFTPLYLGIPISMRQLENSHFIYRISQILQELEFKPEWLLLELQETFSNLSIEGIEKSFNMLKYLGIKLAMDHYGVCPYSLSQLKRLAVHYLKLDAEIVQDIDQNALSVGLVEASIFLTKKLSMQLIVEGVETEKQLAALQALGCTLVEGKYIGLPISESEVKKTMVEMV